MDVSEIFINSIHNLGLVRLQRRAQRRSSGERDSLMGFEPVRTASKVMPVLVGRGSGCGVDKGLRGCFRSRWLGHD